MQHYRIRLLRRVLRLKARTRVRMQDLDPGNPIRNDGRNAGPREFPPVAASPERMQPIPDGLADEDLQTRKVARDGEVIRIPRHHGPQPFPLIRQRRMTHLPQRRGHCLNLGPQSFPNRLPPHDELSRLARSPTVMSEPQEIESLRLPFTTLLSVGSGEPSKLDQPR